MAVGVCSYRPKPFCWDKIHFHAHPFVTLNGRLYSVANVRRHGGPASIYPIPADDLNTTLLRRVLLPARISPGGCGTGITPGPACPAADLRWQQPAFGPMWWATDAIPSGYENISSSFGIRPSSAHALTPEQAADLAAFRDTAHARRTSTNACRNGPCGPTQGEQTVYAVKGSAEDVILYRGHGGVVPHGWPVQFPRQL